MDRRDTVAGGSVPVYNLAGRVVGTIAREPDGTTWLTKFGLDPLRHRLNRPPAWCIDADHLEALRDAGGYGVRLKCIDGTTWIASLDAFEQHGIAFDRHHGRQVALPLRYWSLAGPDRRQPSLPEPSLTAPASPGDSARSSDLES
jgi:hypothetical protein